MVPGSVEYLHSACSFSASSIIISVPLVTWKTEITAALSLKQCGDSQGTEGLDQIIDLGLGHFPMLSIVISGLEFLDAACSAEKFDGGS